MAKIALIASRISPQVMALAHGLLSQRHQVQIITSYKTDFSSDIEPLPDLEILAYFKKWSWLEALKLTPRILQNPPDVFHFIFEDLVPDDKFEDQNIIHDQAHWAHQILSQIALGLRRSTVVTVGNSSVDTKRWQKSSFLKSCQALIAPSREKLMSLKRQGIIDRNMKTEVILPLPIPDRKQSRSQESQQGLQDLCKKWAPYLLVPGQPRKKIVDQLLEMTKDSGLKLIFLGSRSEKVFADLRITCLSNLELPEIETLTQKSQAVMLATHEYEPSELMQWQATCSMTKTSIVALRRQVETVPGLCQHEKNGFILDQLNEDFKKILSNNPKLELQSYNRREDFLSPLDHSLNNINRIYASVMATTSVQNLR